MTASIATAFILFIPFSSISSPGGISIQGTRIVYPLSAEQQTISIRNSSKESRYLVQTWVEDEEGQHSNEFISTPPIYISAPSSENIIRIVRTSNSQPKDRESLYYFIAKAIPPVNQDAEDGSVIRVSAANRIKLFLRPEGLGKPEDWIKKITFKVINSSEFLIKNESPYFFTLTKIKSKGTVLDGVMVPPFDEKKISLRNKGKIINNRVDFEYINDFGAIIPVHNVRLE